jgi:hypothetical protein
LAQVRGLRGLDSSDLKTKYDLEYVATFSPLMDLTLMVATINTLLRRRKGAVRARDTAYAPPVEEQRQENISLRNSGQLTGGREEAAHYKRDLKVT